jgi:hypothetical protein
MDALRNTFANPMACSLGKRSILSARVREQSANGIADNVCSSVRFPRGVDGRTVQNANGGLASLTESRQNRF